MTRLREENEALRQNIEELSVETILLERSIEGEEPTSDEELSRGISQETASPIFSERSYEIPDKVKSLNQSELARRLGVSPATVRRHKSQNSFPQWSQERDPQKIAWKYRRGKFYPMRQGELIN